MLVSPHLIHLDLELCCLVEDVEHNFKILLELGSNSKSDITNGREDVWLH